jgi:CheY-like chemotaxis protein
MMPKPQLRLLVVDDISTNRLLLQRSLKNALVSEVKGGEAVCVDVCADGHLAVEAALGVDATQAAQYGASGGWPADLVFEPGRGTGYDVILMDAEMPVMSGLVVRALLPASHHCCNLKRISSISRMLAMMFHLYLTYISHPLQASRMLRAGGFTGLIFGCSGHDSAEHVRLFMEAGADRVFSKPLQTDQILDAICKLLSGR